MRESTPIFAKLKSLPEDVYNKEFRSITFIFDLKD
ncbi:hypothetical protein HCH_00881 [Hahella chejuensis KCTC 2396]|uniref:Uncharacterized protein n=1 Tax=Hahella chejuensis (strain KCTC 2396) TaxID=349521 RepID=Q2SNK1_HAHCH|nr:hypothetical protein HCH_00881 [Hahella chejuensis KCTC 2396]